MAQAQAQAQATVQAEVNVRTLQAAAARTAIAHPVELRRGEIRSITLTIPLLTERNSYLVARLPDSVVRDLIAHVRTLPEAERPVFMRNWVIRNQQAILERYVSGGERRFRYDVVPFQAVSRAAEAVPRRTETQARQVEATPRRTEPEAARISGNGTRASPFVVNVQRGRSSRDDLSGQEVEIPVNFDVGGRVYFRFNVTLSQISNSTIDATYAEMISTARAAIGRMPEHTGGRVSLRQDLPGFRRTVRESLASRPNFIRYMESH